MRLRKPIEKNAVASLRCRRTGFMTAITSTIGYTVYAEKEIDRRDQLPERA